MRGCDWSSAVRDWRDGARGDSASEREIRAVNVSAIKATPTPPCAGGRCGFTLSTPLPREVNLASRSGGNASFGGHSTSSTRVSAPGWNESTCMCSLRSAGEQAVPPASRWAVQGRHRPRSSAATGTRSVPAIVRWLADPRQQLESWSVSCRGQNEGGASLAIASEGRNESPGRDCSRSAEGFDLPSAHDRKWSNTFRCCPKSDYKNYG